MDAYDTAVLSYALATAANKLKPGMLNLREDVSLTPPTTTTATTTSTTTNKGQNDDDVESNRSYFYNLLSNMHNSLLNKYPIQTSQMLELCSIKNVSIKLIIFQFFFLFCFYL